MSPLADIQLKTDDGTATSLRSYAGTPLVIQFVRYFGCLPCQVYLRALDRAAPSLSRIGARALAVGGSADYQARWLRETGVTMPLLLDPTQALRGAVGLGSLAPFQLLDPRGIRNYVVAALRGARLQVPTADLSQSPGMALLDSALAIRWTYTGKTLGDYPPLGVVIGRAARLEAGGA